MLTAILLILLALILLFFGAEWLVKGSASLAIRLGLTPLVVGLTVVAFGTSMPEMVVSVNATLAGQGDIAAGNVVGSNIFNIGVILGLAALICPIRVGLPILRLDAPLMAGVTALAVFLLMRQEVGRLAGIGLFAGLLVYVAWTVIMARREGTNDPGDYEEGVPGPTRSPWLDGLFILLGLVLLVAGSRFLVGGATTLARGFGVSEAVIGLTIVAAGTSMPELATSVLAALRKQPDIAIGNVVGSNLFNLLGILGVAATVRPLSTPGIQPLDLWVMLGFSLLLFPLLWTAQKLVRWEGSVLLVGYGIYLYLLWPK